METKYVILIELNQWMGNILPALKGNNSYKNTQKHIILEFPVSNNAM